MFLSPVPTTLHLYMSQIIFTSFFCLQRNAGVQNELPQGVPQKYANYFELKAILAAGSRDTLSLPLTTICMAGQTSIY